MTKDEIFCPHCKSRKNLKVIVSIQATMTEATLRANLKADGEIKFPKQLTKVYSPESTIARYENESGNFQLTLLPDKNDNVPKIYCARCTEIFDAPAECLSCIPGREEVEEGCPTLE